MDSPTTVFSRWSPQLADPYALPHLLAGSALRIGQDDDSGEPMNREGLLEYMEAQTIRTMTHLATIYVEDLQNVDRFRELVNKAAKRLLDDFADPDRGTSWFPNDYRAAVINGKVLWSFLPVTCCLRIAQAKR